jgi:ABC-2 type transport system ATP-binding protein
VFEEERNMEPIIKAVNVTRKFGDLVALDHLNLEIPKGEIFGLVGPDGAGKTTTLRLFCGLLDPTQGEVQVAGFDASKQTDQVRDRIGYMAQRFGLYQDLTVEENMDFYADLFGITGAERDRLKGELLPMTRMEPFRNREAGKLSGGMKQKLALMCTLLHHPQILFLDEPTNGVDPLSRRDFWAILYQLIKDGVTVFVATAYLDEAERCNRVGLLHRGKLIHCDTPDNLKRLVPAYAVRHAEASLEDAFVFLVNQAEYANPAEAPLTSRRSSPPDSPATSRRSSPPDSPAQSSA